MNNRRKQLMLASAREYCKCVVEGKTIKYNQVLVEGNFPTTNSWHSNGLTANIANNVLSVNTTTAYQSVYNANALVEGHKYLFCLWARNLNNIPSFAFGWHSGYSSDISITSEWRLYACVTPQVTSGSDYVYIYPRGVGSAEFKQYQIIDLTELGLDNINSVADFYATDLGKYIAKGNYLETTSGAFIQAKTPINFKGVNIWNEQWENCYYHEGQNGQKVYYPNTVGCKDKISVFPNTQYYFNGKPNYYWYVLFYDKNGSYLNDYKYSYNKDTFVTPSNCYYITFYFSGANTYNHDICINEYNENYNGKYYKYCGRTSKVFVINYNQQIKNGNFATTDDWTSLNCNLSASNNELKCRTTGGTTAQKSITCVVEVVKEHKYLLLFKAKAPRNVYGYVTIGSSASMGDYLMYDTYSQQNYIFTNPLLEGEQNLNIFIDYGQNTGWLTSGEDVYIKECMLIDLTALGMDNISTISDFNNTDLGQLIAEKGYLPYSQRNVGYALGKQLQKGDYYKTYSVDKISYNNLIPNANQDYTNDVSDTNPHVTDFTFKDYTLAEYILTANLSIGNNGFIFTAQFNSTTNSMYFSGYEHNLYFANDINIVENHKYFLFINAESLTVSEIGGYVLKRITLIDLTLLGLDNVTTLEEFYRTPLGMLVKKGFYLNYTTSNKTIKPQLIRTMKEIDMEDLNWQEEEFGYYALLPSDCKKVEGSEMPNLLATDYKTSSRQGAQYMDLYIDDVWGIGWCFVVRDYHDFPTGKLMYELNTPIIVDEDIEDIMVSRRTINVESDNGVDLDFTKE